MMPRFVAFLRGINIGGRTVKKDKLHEIFNSLGFENVSTFKQSGNVIFDTTTNRAEEINAKIEDKLGAALGYDVKVLLRTLEQLKAILTSEPFKGQKQEGSSFLVTMLPNETSSFPLQLPLTIPKSTAQIISCKGLEVFSVTHGGGEGALPNPFVEAKLKVKTTTRNMNIIAEIIVKYC